jgi:hypothetical protein
VYASRQGIKTITRFCRWKIRRTFGRVKNRKSNNNKVCFDFDFDFEDWKVLTLEDRLILASRVVIESINNGPVQVVIVTLEIRQTFASLSEFGQECCFGLDI